MTANLNDSFYGASPNKGNVEAIIAGLNLQQREAVTTDAQAVLVVAGAGSGKTRVLTRRIAYLLATQQARSSEILAITFTNKAAAEMRERVIDLVGNSAGSMWVSTFHSACVRILRREYKHADLTSSFSIYDASDSQRLIKMICKDHNIDEKRWSPKTIGNRISDLKNQLISPAGFEPADSSPTDLVVSEVYKSYSKRLKAANALDFDDLIMRTVQLLENKPEVARSYQQRFRHILVDEYQDTNHAQYRLVRALVGLPNNADKASELAAINSGLAPGHLMVVGDSDQSIYAFRGATIRNIEEFEEDFPDAQVILLEQNYRSTQTILSAANAVISHNQGRHAKNLWTDAGQGARIVYDSCDSDKAEAQTVVGHIDELLSTGTRYSDIAVFYRTNAQSRVLEEIFMRGGIPYRVIGGTKFYERMEIKDALAYLRSASNPLDDINFGRIINTPKRGLGDKTIALLRAHADLHGVSLAVAAGHVWAQQKREADEAITWSDEVVGFPYDSPDVAGIPTRARQALADLWQVLVNARDADSRDVPVSEILDIVLGESGYLASLQASKDPQDANRVDNLAEFHAVATEFTVAEPDGRLVDFLERVALVADADQIDDSAGQVTLMTVHTAKGLEYPVVFVTGMEDGTFPHQRCLGSISELAEERRLAYVAITRARERLFLSRASYRTQWGMPIQLGQSRFIQDIPAELLDERCSSSNLAGRAVRYSYEQSEQSERSEQASGSWVKNLHTTTRTTSPQRMIAPQNNDGPRLESIEIGERVHHPSHGMGKVLEVGGGGNNRFAVIDFGDGNVKRLILRFAPLEKL